MCTVCGCGQATVEGQKAHDHDHDHDHDHHHHHHDHHDHDHNHDHSHDHHHHGDHVHEEGDNVHYGKGMGGAHVPGLSQSRIIEIEQNILGKNDRLAMENRAAFAAKGQFVLNLVSSPGSGKTTLLTRTVSDMKDSFPVAVIEGDQQTANDADRIRETGVPAIQVNTGKGCHLDAHMVGHAAEKLDLAAGGLLFIENVGNLVCPAAFDLGEAHKVAILSVTEGEDKPIKYPDMFDAADLMILTKVDLLPYLTFDVDKCIDYAKRVNPNIQVLLVSSTSGDGLENWYDWIKQGAAGVQQSLAAQAGE